MMIYVLCGIPGSGKTTIANQLAEQHGYKVHSYDELCSEDISDIETKKKWFDNIRTDLLSGRNVICDCRCLESGCRKWILQQFADISCEKVLLFKVVPLEICLERNALREGKAKLSEEHIRRCLMSLEPPTKDEGWDKIYVYKD